MMALTLHRGWLILAPLALFAVLAALAPVAARAQGEAPIAPGLVGLDERVSLTALDLTLEHVAAFVSDQCSYTVVVDPRWHHLSVSLAAEGTLAEVLSALCLATNLEARRLDRWIVLTPSRDGIAVVAREVRRQHAPRLVEEQRNLAARRESAVHRALGHLGLGTPGQALAQLSEWQFGALRDQGYLTVSQLFPEYYSPLYDVFRYYAEARAPRPPSLPEFAGTRVYLDPALLLELHIVGAGGAGEVAWPVELIPVGGR